MNKQIAFFFGLLLSSFQIIAQENSDTAIPFQSPSLQTFAPSRLVQTGHYEYKFFNNLYTQNKVFNDGGKRFATSRSTYFTSINQLLIGVSPRLNIGADVWVKGVRYGASRNESALKVLAFDNETNVGRWAVAYAGPKIKFQPAPQALPNFSIQSTFLFATAKNLETQNNVYLSNNANIWINQLMYDKTYNQQFQLFLQASGWLYFNKNKTTDKVTLATPLTAFFSYFPTKKTTLYIENEFWPVWGQQSYFNQTGIGGKLQIVANKLELEASYTNFLFGKNSGAGNTFNVGIRLLN